MASFSIKSWSKLADGKCVSILIFLSSFQVLRFQKIHCHHLRLTFLRGKNTVDFHNGLIKKKQFLETDWAVTVHCPFSGKTGIIGLVPAWNKMSKRELQSFPDFPSLDLLKPWGETSIKAGLTALRYGPMYYFNVRYVRQGACAFEKPLFTWGLKWQKCCCESMLHQMQESASSPKHLYLIRRINQVQLPWNQVKPRLSMSRAANRILEDKQQSKSWFLIF